MSKVLIVSLLLAAFLTPGFALADAQEVTSTDLIEKAKELDGQTVTYSGEVIGDIMKNGDHTWLNVSDGTNAVGIWASSEEVQDVILPGRYNQHGDTVQVEGVFHRACKDHGGDMDIHLSNAILRQRGCAIPHAVEPQRMFLALALLAASSVLAVVLFKSAGKSNRNLSH